MQYHIDLLTSDGLQAWAWSPDGIKRVSIYVNNTRAGDALLGTINRPDVRAALGGKPDTDALGFSFLLPPRLPEMNVPDRDAEISLELETGAGEVTRSPWMSVPTLPLTFAAHPETFRQLAFPRPVTELLLRKYGPRILDLKANAGYSQDLLHRVVFLAQNGPGEWRDFKNYLVFLKTIQSRFDHVRANFPRWNLQSEPGRKDFNGAATTADEMMAIAHHLYVLKSYGVTGDVCEFGCFKGCSTSMLSFACQLLGLKMHVFDSFEGLPDGGSSYYNRGEFRGGLDEVKANVATFGCPEVVTFHKGFFSDTLPHVSVSPMLIWMDVDLESSARDVMAVLPRLPRESAVFSHECPSECFLGEGQIDQKPGTDNVLPPIVQAFHADGRQPVGAHIFDCTGAVWDANTAIPALPAKAVRWLAGNL